jgi:hypothetical protein
MGGQVVSTVVRRCGLPVIGRVVLTVMWSPRPVMGGRIVVVCPRRIRHRVVGPVTVVVAAVPVVAIVVVSPMAVVVMVGPVVIVVVAGPGVAVVVAVPVTVHAPVVGDVAGSLDRSQSRVARACPRHHDRSEGDDRERREDRHRSPSGRVHISHLVRRWQPEITDQGDSRRPGNRPDETFLAQALADIPSTTTTNRNWQIERSRPNSVVLGGDSHREGITGTLLVTRRGSTPVMILLQMPGGVELLVILLIFLILVGVPAVLLLGALYVLRRRSRVEELEEEVDALEAEVEELRAQQE